MSPATMRAGAVTQVVPIFIDTIQGIKKFVVRAGNVAIPVSSVEILDLLRSRTAVLQVAPLDFEVSVNGGATDTFDVKAVPRPSGTLDVPSVPEPFLTTRAVAATTIASIRSIGCRQEAPMPKTICVAFRPTRTVSRFHSLEPNTATAGTRTVSWNGKR